MTTTIPAKNKTPTINHVPYRDKASENIPEWYANYRYDPHKTLRESYIDNALTSYSPYSFYYQRRKLNQEMLKASQEAERKWKQKVKERELEKKSMNWRKNVRFVL